MSNSIAAADPPRDTNGQQQDDNPFEAKASEEARKPKPASLLSQIRSGKRVRPILTLLYGPPGIGKSTFASQAPRPIFLPVERSVDQLDVESFPTPRTFEEFYRQVRTLNEEEHSYQTIVIDTADALEALIWARVCAEYKVDSIEKPSYGNGFTRAKTIWRGLLNQLVDMNERFNIVILCHAHIKQFADPALSAPYDTWRIKLHEKSAEVLREMVDNILFACMDVELHKDNIKDRKGKGVVNGDRIIRTSPGTGFEAKNRFNLPDHLPLAWEPFETAVKEFYAK
jgi:AAA domain